MTNRTNGLLVALLLATGCSTFHPANDPLQSWDLGHGYRPTLVQAERPVGDVLLLLAFSGGGTRAAALAYGVLEELRDTRVTGAGVEKRLLDEVDMISSVSGGSFTAAYYGLFGDRLFDDFEQRFLRRDIQDRLVVSLFRPYNWVRLLTGIDRTDLAVELYDREIFDGATFADLRAADGPFVNINATDLAVGNHFTFVQPQFDLICSDLSTYRVARAVAASSSVPVLFDGITLKNRAGTCGFEMPSPLARALEDARSDPRRYHAARIATSYLDAKQRPYIHLVDGGVSDNVGLRSPLDNVILGGGLQKRLEQIGAEPPLELVVVVVDAEVHYHPEFSLKPSAPGITEVLSAITATQINRYTFETIELVRDHLERWARTLPPRKDGRPIRARMVNVGFDFIPDVDERAYFETLPTSFKLHEEQVDRLIAVGRQLLRDDPEFQSLLHELGGADAVEDRAAR